MILVLLSPSKAMNFDPTTLEVTSNPALDASAMELAEVMKGYDTKGIADLMSLSDNLAELNFDRFQNFGDAQQASKQAILAFTGDTYKDIPLEEYTEDDFAVAQKHVRILSGLYGVLRPLDLIHPYRLEMGTKLKTERGTSLYDYWGDRVTEELNAELEGEEDAVVLNCASNEYFKVVNKKKLGAKAITPVFKDYSKGKYKVISFYAKRARGMMADFVVRNRIDSADGLRDLTAGVYAYVEDASTPRKPVFLRKQD